jgi:hypothetical protein
MVPLGSTDTVMATRLGTVTPTVEFRDHIRIIDKRILCGIEVIFFIKSMLQVVLYDKIIKNLQLPSTLDHLRNQLRDYPDHNIV